MGVMCNNSFLVQIKTEGGFIPVQSIEKMIKKMFGRNVSMSVSEYVPLPPKMKRPEKKAGDWTIAIKTKNKSNNKVYCKNCEHYISKSPYPSRDNQDYCNHKLNLNHDVREATYLEPKHTVATGHILPPVEKNANNDCKDFKQTK